MDKIALVSKSPNREFQLPFLWATLKTYYESNGKHHESWQWMDPCIVWNNHDDIVRDIVQARPKVIGFSVYTWNEGTFIMMAEQIKNSLPDSYIIFGGPQQDVAHNDQYFVERPFLDMVIPGDAYGEIIMSALLDNIASNGKLHSDQIPYCWYPDDDRNRTKVDIPIDKRNFSWPPNPFRAQEHYLKKYLKENDASTSGWTMLETSRGCPYRCSFCDWGGGTYTKTVKKPFATVMDEIKWTAENKIYGLYFSDANFGLYDIDIEYMKHVAECKKQYGYPKNVIIQPTKTKLKNLEDIFCIMAENKLMSHLKIAVEDLNDHVLDNIDRVDFPFEEKVKMVKRIQAKYDVTLFIEGIIGLPGSSMETVRNDIDRTIGQDIDFPTNHTWVLLPETPAFDPAYREKWKIETIRQQDILGAGTNHVSLKIKEGESYQEGVRAFEHTGSIDSRGEFVVSTSSYTKEDLIQMTSIQWFVLGLHNTNIAKPIAKYLHDYHNRSWGDIYFELKDYLVNDSPLSHHYSKIEQRLTEWVQGKGVDFFIDYDAGFKYLIGTQSFIIFVALLNPNEFFGPMGDFLARKYQDDRFRDLAEFCKFSSFTFDYQPNQQATFDHNWMEWLLHEPLVNGGVTYRAMDDSILVGSELLPVDWNEDSAHFFYRVCYTSIAKKNIKNMIRIN